MTAAQMTEGFGRLTRSFGEWAATRDGAEVPRVIGYDDLRQHLERQAGTEQDLGDDYAETPGETALEQAHRHWGSADAYRAMVRHIEHEQESSPS